MTDAGFEIRRCRRADLAAVQDLEAASFPNGGALPLLALVQYFDVFNATFYVAVTPQELLGFAIAGASSSTPHLGWLLDVAVANGGRRRGVALALVESAAAALCAAGVKQLWATVGPQNIASRNLCIKAGFRVEREEPEYFGAAQARLVLVKES